MEAPTHGLLLLDYFSLKTMKVPFLVSSFAKLSELILSPIVGLQNMFKDHFFRMSGSQLNEQLYGPEKLSGIFRNGPLH